MITLSNNRPFSPPVIPNRNGLRRDLVEMFGDEYRRCKQRVSMLMPWRYLTKR